jgi:hypothetical protein
LIAHGDFEKSTTTLRHLFCKGLLMYFGHNSNDTIHLTTKDVTEFSSGSNTMSGFQLKKTMKTLNILSYFGKLIAKTSNFHSWSTCVAQNLQRMPFLGHTPPCTRPISSTNTIFLIVERNFTVALEAKYIQKNRKNNSLCTFYPRCILRSWY